MMSTQLRDYEKGLTTVWAKIRIVLCTSLAQFVNKKDGPNRITIKYFTKGHNSMSADSFHKQVEDSMRKTGEVCDWSHFQKCVSSAGQSIDMNVTDFYDFPHSLCQGNKSKEGKPRLEEVSVGEFCKGSTSWFYKYGHREDESFKEHDFLKKQLHENILKDRLIVNEKPLY